MSWSYGVRKAQRCIQFLPVRLQNFLFLPLLHLKTVIPSQASFPWRGVWSSAGRLTVNPNATVVRPPAGCRGRLYFHAGDHCFPSVMHGMHLHFDISALLCSLGPQGSGRWGFLLRGHRKSGGRKESNISTWVEGNYLLRQPFWTLITTNLSVRFQPDLFPNPVLVPYFLLRKLLPKPPKSPELAE